MQEYDATLKLLLRQSARFAIRELTGTDIETWLDVELPKVQNLRVDLLGETRDGCLIHLELQSSNDPSMALRMAEYCLGIQRLLGRAPHQVCLYVGTPPLRMPTELRGPGFSFHYNALDIRTLDGEYLLHSPDIGDNVIAILARLQNHTAAIRRIMDRVVRLPEVEREAALRQLLIFAGLRGFEEVIEQEIRNMPLEIDIRENKVLGREYKRGELMILRRVIEKRFGPIPTWAEERLTSKSAAELEDLSPRVLDAPTLEDLLQ
jgi:hypothetical protein